MKYCQRCGQPLHDDAEMCPRCGVACPPMYPHAEDKSSFWWGLLCCLFPIVGLILYLVWRKEYPKRANSCGNGAIIGVCLSILGSILLQVGAMILLIFSFT